MVKRKATRTNPVQCCKCGFLCGVMPGGYTRRDVYFDPDRLRLNISKEERIQHSFVLTTHVYQMRDRDTQTIPDNSFGARSGFITVPYDTVRACNYTWDMCRRIGCYRGVWNEDDLSLEKHPGVIDEIDRERRGECDLFFSYRRGLSVDEHVEEQRLERAERLHQGIQWVAIGISVLSLFFSIAMPLWLNPVERITIIEPVPIIVEEPTVTPMPTIALTPTLIAPLPMNTP